MIERDLPRGANALTACQARAARAMMMQSVRQLSLASGLSESTLRRIEAGFGIPKTVSLDLLFRLQKWFESQGFVFSWDEESGPGVAWKDYPIEVAREGDANSTDDDNGSDLVGVLSLAEPLVELSPI